MAHPTSCANPDTCLLSYRDHLLGISVSPAATPSRAVTRTPGLPDEPTSETRARERRMGRDLPAFKRLREAGVRASTRGAAEQERRLGG